MSEKALEALSDAGLVAQDVDGQWSFSFADELFGSEARRKFDAYRAAVRQYETALDRRRDGEDVGTATIRVLDAKRSRCHNEFATGLARDHPITGWDHEHYRRWAAAMTRHTMPWLSNRVLPLTASSVVAVATALQAEQGGTEVQDR